MVIDYTRLKQKLLPENRVGGDPGLELRVGTISAVNADLTASVTISGATVTNVPALASATIETGSVVQLLSYRGSLLILGPVSGKRFIRKNGDQSLTLNSTSLQDVTDLTFTAEAGAVYMLELLVSYDGHPDQDIKMAWTVPSGATMARWVSAPDEGSANAESTSISMVRRGAATQQTAGVPTTNTDFTTWHEKILLTMGSTAGSVQLQAAQRAAGSSSPATSIRSQSLLVIERIG